MGARESEGRGVECEREDGRARGARVKARGE